METREQRGLAIAATQKITRTGDSWLVPSQSAPRKTYVVRPNPERPYCSCPDHDALGIKCKHIFAVEFVKQRELFPDGDEQVTQTVTVTEKVKKTYKQDWPAYNAAQTNEKDKFLMLLHDLCKGIVEPVQVKGRKRIPLADMVFSACFKIYSTFSGRRFMSDLRAAQEKGYIRKTPHYNSIFNYLESPELFEVLRSLIVQSSLPLKAVETEFAVDSTGFSGCRFIRWHEVKHEGRPPLTDYVKAHLCCGVKTNVVTSVEIHDKATHDSPMLKPLLLKTAENFRIGEVSGDKAYASKANYEMVEDLGGTGYFAFKDSTTGGIGGLWAKMYHYFCYRQPEFLAHYHKRSNIESTNMMIKTKFRDSVRSKTEVAAKNEVLCKIVCHNIVVLIHEMYELGVEPVFWQEVDSAQKLGTLPKSSGQNQSF